MTGTARIVLVEDDPAVAELVTLYLRNAGSAITHAPTAAKARELFAEMRPGLVILDLGLPDADGNALFAEIRARSDSPATGSSSRCGASRSPGRPGRSTCT